MSDTVMATKLDTEKKLFLGNTPVREATTFGAIRKSVNELNTGEGVTYADLEKHLLDNFKPAKSENYGPSYIKSYVRDAVGKYGYLSHEDLGTEYTVTEPPAKKEPAEAKPKALTKAQKARVEVLAVIRDKGEVADESDLDATKITLADVVTETKKKAKTVDTMVADLEKESFVRTEKVDDSTYVFLTPTGLKHVNENSPATTAEATESADAAAEAAGAEDNGEA